MDFEYLFLAAIPYNMLVCAIPYHVVVIRFMIELIKDKDYYKYFGFYTYFLFFVCGCFIVAYDVILVRWLLGL